MNKLKEFWIVTDPIAEGMYEAFSTQNDPRNTGNLIHVQETTQVNFDIFCFEEVLKNLKSDLNVIKNDKYHPRVHDLLNIVISEDIPSLILFVEKVNKIFSKQLPEATGDQFRGFKCAFETLKREIYETF